MGYAGGESKDPTYHNLGGHTETIEVDLDPATLSFSDFLELFWQSHDPFARKRSRQYMTALFWRDAQQRGIARDAVQRLERERGRKVTTELLAFDDFYLAEDYHQKYLLRRHRDFEARLLEAYPDLRGFVDSTAAARLNGYLGGHGSRDALLRELPLLGLSPEAGEQLLALHAR